MKLAASFLAVSLSMTASGAPPFGEAVPPVDANQANTPAVTAVPCGSLKPFLPVLTGWVRGDIRCDPTEVNVSRVQVDYERGMSGLSIEIIDSANGTNVQAPITDLIKSQHAELRPDGYTRPTTTEGFPGIEEWTSEPGNGEVHLLVGDRYMIKLRGDTVPGIDTIRWAATQIGLKRLAALR